MHEKVSKTLKLETFSRHYVHGGTGGGLTRGADSLGLATPFVKIQNRKTRLIEIQTQIYKFE